MNLPNRLTILRIILVPIIVIVTYLPINGQFLGIPVLNLIILTLFVIASITDQLDGYLARKNNEVTDFGKFLDPIADKILVITLLIYLSSKGIIPYWICVIIVFREFLISGYRLVLSSKNGKVVAANILGKLKTVTQIISIIFALLTTSKFFAFCFEQLTGINLIANIIMSIFMLIQLVLTIVSAIDYMKDFKKYI